MVEIDETLLSVLVDIISHSMDFGSGFLDTEEVEALRAAAVLIGIDPIEVTPAGHAVNYPHRYVSPENVHLLWSDRCAHCNKKKDTHEQSN